jgi:Xaa-Pro aminopeptidase
MGIGSGSRDTVNVERLHQFMDGEGLAAVVARSGQNFTYLSGLAYPGTLARHVDIADSTRAVMLLWPRHGDPVIVLNAIAEKLTLRDSWVKRVSVYDAYNESPYARLCQVIKEAGLDGQRIGFEKNYVSAEHWDEMRRGLPRAEMVDCNRMMDAVRWVKTPAELALLRKGADLLDDAYAEVFLTIKHGETERAVHSRLIGSCLRRGANWAHGILNSHRNTIPYAGESDELFLNGDVVRTDYVAYLDGYPGHQSRVAILGKPSAALREDYARYYDAYLKIIDACRPGVTAGAVYDFAVETFGKLGWTYTSILVGHSVGAWWHQQEPIVARGRDLTLEEGMVLALEPHGLNPGPGFLHLQDMAVVRRSGPELLSAKFPTHEMFVIE